MRDHIIQWIGPDGRVYYFGPKDTITGSLNNAKLYSEDEARLAVDDSFPGWIILSPEETEILIVMAS